MSLNGALFNAEADDHELTLVQNERVHLRQDGVALDFESGGGYPGQGLNVSSSSGILWLSTL